MKTKELKMIGYQITGTVEVTFWDGDKGELSMYPFELYHPEKTVEEIIQLIPQGVNDGEFGVRSIDCALVEIHELYECEVTDFIETTDITASKENPFNGGTFNEDIKGKLKRPIAY